jgi:endonuclease-3
MSQVSIEQVIALLSRDYGRPHWQPDHRPLAGLIRTILSQNTSDVNSHRAFASLLAAFPGWEEMAAAEVGEIARAIRVGGLGEIKAPRIKQALAEIKRQRGRLELDFLNALPLAAAREWLLRLPGVGTKTANCVFLFSLGIPALPVDTHRCPWIRIFFAWPSGWGWSIPKHRWSRPTWCSRTWCPPMRSIRFMY